MLLAYGRLVSNIERVNDAEMDKLKQEAEAAVGNATIGGPIEALREREIELRAVFAERLPVMTPTDYGLVISPQLLTQVQSLIQQARAHRPSLPTEAAEWVHRRLLHHTAKAFGEFGQTIPRYTDGRAPEHEWLIHLATQAEAEFLVTRDERIALDPTGGTEYVHEQTRRRTKAWRLDAFVEEIEGLHFTLDDVGTELPDIP
ncbi:MAG TPA: hypothetical protein VFN18_11470 [Solirubrobacterales bacterium]|nr:hypothetical protein [Solirubrobacterales bacterium]